MQSEYARLEELLKGDFYQNIDAQAKIKQEFEQLQEKVATLEQENDTLKGSQLQGNKVLESLRDKLVAVTKKLEEAGLEIDGNPADLKPGVSASEMQQTAGLTSEKAKKAFLNIYRPKENPLKQQRPPGQRGRRSIELSGSLEKPKDTLQNPDELVVEYQDVYKENTSSLEEVPYTDNPMILAEQLLALRKKSTDLANENERLQEALSIAKDEKVTQDEAMAAVMGNTDKKVQQIDALQRALSSRDANDQSLQDLFESNKSLFITGDDLKVLQALQQSRVEGPFQDEQTPEMQALEMGEREQDLSNLLKEYDKSEGQNLLNALRLGQIYRDYEAKLSYFQMKIIADTLRDEKSQVSDELSTVQQVNQDLSGQLHSAEVLKGKIATAEKEIKALQDQNKSLQSSSDLLQKSLDESKTQGNNKSHQIDALNGQYTELQKQNEQLSAANTRLKQDIAQQSDVFGTQSKEVEAERQKLQSELEQAKKALAKQKDEGKGLQEQVDGAIKERDDALDQIETLKGAVHSSSQEILSQKTMINEKEEQIRSLHDKSAAKLKKAQEELSSSHKENKRLNKALSDQDTALQVAESHLSASKQKEGELQTQLDGLQSQLAELNSKNSTLQVKKGDQAREITDLQNKIKEVESDLKKSQEASQQASTQSQQDVKTLQDEKKGIEGKVEDLGRQLQDAQQALDGLKEVQLVSDREQEIMQRRLDFEQKKSGIYAAIDTEVAEFAKTNDIAPLEGENLDKVKENLLAQKLAALNLEVAKEQSVRKRGVYDSFIESQLKDLDEDSSERKIFAAITPDKMSYKPEADLRRKFREGNQAVFNYLSNELKEEAPAKSGKGIKSVHDKMRVIKGEFQKSYQSYHEQYACEDKVKALAQKGKSLLTKVKQSQQQAKQAAEQQQKKIADLRDEVTTLTKNGQGQQSAIEKLTAALTASEQSTTKLTTSHQAELEALKTELEASKVNNNKIEEEKKSLQDGLTRAEGQVSSLENDIDRLKEQYESQGKGLAASQTEGADLNGKLLAPLGEMRQKMVSTAESAKQAAVAEREKELQGKFDAEMKQLKDRYQMSFEDFQMQKDNFTKVLEEKQASIVKLEAEKEAFQVSPLPDDSSAEKTREAINSMIKRKYIQIKLNQDQVKGLAIENEQLRKENEKLKLQNDAFAQDPSASAVQESVADKNNADPSGSRSASVPSLRSKNSLPNQGGVGGDSLSPELVRGWSALSGNSQTSLGDSNSSLGSLNTAFIGRESSASSKINNPSSLEPGQGFCLEYARTVKDDDDNEVIKWDSQQEFDTHQKTYAHAEKVKNIASSSSGDGEKTYSTKLADNAYHTVRATWSVDSQAEMAGQACMEAYLDMMGGVEAVAALYGQTEALKQVKFDNVDTLVKNLTDGETAIPISGSEVFQNGARAALQKRVMEVSPKNASRNRLRGVDGSLKTARIGLAKNPSSSFDLRSTSFGRNHSFQSKPNPRL